ncbi:hypothetical protein [Mycoplasmopsis gallopavonis]|uniref:Uncharacterized protein n=1 Tax=Mycoplasmopsis gallopavonis TaxID=76629 RepID=A0A449B088_9BACT|nr:hypothetical protein [Mycoplasmopsis gallopavonis]RIV16852.1 hypothetical protein D1113_00725 [Mycoplasmopsis gallopavonis]VEU73156.1 Uncharacterised protein [Mycoplasmopsis gallopavonis]
MTKKSKYLLLGVAGVLVGTGVVAIPVAVTADAKAKAAKERKQALNELDSALTASEVSAAKAREAFELPAEFDGWVVDTFNSLSKYHEPKAIAKALANVEALQKEAENAKLNRDYTNDEYRKLAKKIVEAQQALEEALRENARETDAKKTEIRNLINSFSDEVKKTKIVQDAQNALEKNYVKTPTQGHSILVLLGLKVVQGALNQEVLDFFNKNTAKDLVHNNATYQDNDRVLLSSVADVQNEETPFDASQNFKRRYQETTTTNIFNKLWRAYIDAREVATNKSYNEVTFIENFKTFSGFPTLVKNLTDALKAAKAEKARVNDELRAAHTAYLDAATSAKKLVAHEVFTDTGVVVNNERTNSEDKHAREYTTEKLAEFDNNVYATSELDTRADNIVKSLYDTQVQSIEVVKADDNFALQKRFYERAFEHATKLVNKTTPVTETTASYEKVEGSADLVNALEAAANSAKQSVDAATEKTTQVYQTAKEQINAAVQTFVSSMLTKSFDEYQKILDQSNQNRKLYQLIIDLVNSSLNEGEAKHDLGSILGSVSVLQEELKNASKLYLTPQEIYVGTEESFKRVKQILDSVKESKDISDADKADLVANTTSSTSTQTTSDAQFGLVNTLEAAYWLDLYQAVIEKGKENLSNADKKAKELIKNFLDKVVTNKNEIIKETPYSEATQALKDALNSVVDKEVSDKKQVEGEEQEQAKTDYELASDYYDQAVQSVNALGNFQYETYKALVNAKLQEGGFTNLPALPGLPNTTVDGDTTYYVNEVAAYEPVTNFNNALEAAKAIVDALNATEITREENPVHPQDWTTLAKTVLPKYREAVEILKDSIAAIELDKARYEYEKTIWETNHLIPIYKDNERLNPQGLYETYIKKSRDLIANAKTDKTISVDKYKEAIKLVQNAVWRANTAANENLQSNKDGAYAEYLRSKDQIKAFNEIKLPTAKLLAVKKAAQALYDEQAPLFVNDEAKKAKLDAYKEKLAALPQESDLISLLSTWENEYNSGNEEKKAEILGKGKEYDSKAKEFIDATKQLATDLGLDLENANYKKVINPESRDITDANEKIHSHEVHKREQERLYKLYRNTQALLVGVLKHEFVDPTNELNREALFTEDDLIKFVAQPKSGDVRQLLKHDIEVLGTLDYQDAKSTSSKLAKLLEDAKIPGISFEAPELPANTSYIYDNLLKPVKAAYLASIEALKAYRASLATDANKARYEALIAAIDKVLAEAAAKEFDPNNETFETYLTDTKKYENELAASKYEKARLDFEAQVKEAEAEATKHTDSNPEGKAIIEKAIAEAQSNVTIKLAEKALTLEKLVDKENVRSKIDELKAELDKKERTADTIKEKLQALNDALTSELTTEKFRTYTNDDSKFAEFTPDMIAEFEKAIKWVKASIMNATVAQAYKEYEGFVELLTKTITRPADKTKAEDTEYALLLAQESVVKAALDSAKTEMADLQTRAAQTDDVVEAAKIYNQEAIQNITLKLAKVQYEQYKARFESLVDVLNKFSHLVDGAQKGYGEEYKTQIQQSENDLSAALRKENITLADQIKAYKDQANELKEEFETVSNEVSASIQPTINKNNDRIQVLAKSTKDFAEGSDNLQTYVKLDGKIVTISNIYDELEVLRKANRRIADDLLPMLLITKSDTTEAWKMEESITDPEVISLIQKYASLYYLNDSQTPEIVQNKDRRIKLLGRIYNATLTNEERVQLEHDLFVAKTREEVTSVRERLERAELLKGLRDAYNEALKAVKEINPLSEEAKSQIAAIEALIKEKDVDSTPIEELDRIYNEKTNELKSIKAREEANAAITKAKDLEKLMSPLVGENSLYKQYSQENASTKTYLDKWEEEGKAKLAQLVQAVADYEAKLADNTTTVTDEQASAAKQEIETKTQEVLAVKKSIDDKVKEQIQKQLTGYQEEIKKQNAILEDNNSSAQDKESARTTIIETTKLLQNSTARLQFVSEDAQTEFKGKEENASKLDAYNSALRTSVDAMKEVLFPTTTSSSN